MKFLKILFLVWMFALSACSTQGPTVKELDTMNKKIQYMYYQADAVIAGFNNLVVAKVLIPGTPSYKKADDIIQKMHSAIEAMEGARTLEEMIDFEADALSVLSAMRVILIEIAKEGVKTDAKCNICARPAYQWSYG